MSLKLPSLLRAEESDLEALPDILTRVVPHAGGDSGRRIHGPQQDQRAVEMAARVEVNGESFEPLWTNP